MSDDVYILIGTQKFKVDGGVIRAVDESGFQSEVLRRLDGIETEQKAIRTEQAGQRKEQTEQREEITSMRTDIQSLTQAMIQFDKEQGITSSRLDDLQTSVYWGFALMGLFIAFVSWLRPHGDTKPESQRVLTESDVRRIIRDMLPELKNS